MLNQVDHASRLSRAVAQALARHLGPRLLGALAREVPRLSADGVQLHFIGEKGGLSEKLTAGLRQAENATAHNQRLVLNVCFNYGGRWDIARAAATSG